MAAAVYRAALPTELLDSRRFPAVSVRGFNPWKGDLEEYVPDVVLTRRQMALAEVSKEVEERRECARWRDPAFSQAYTWMAQRAAELPAQPRHQPGERDTAAPVLLTTDWWQRALRPSSDEAAAPAKRPPGAAAAAAAQAAAPATAAPTGAARANPPLGGMPSSPISVLDNLAAPWETPAMPWAAAWQPPTYTALGVSLSDDEDEVPGASGCEPAQGPTQGGAQGSWQALEAAWDARWAGAAGGECSSAAEPRAEADGMAGGQSLSQAEPRASGGPLSSLKWLAWPVRAWPAAQVA